MVDYQMPLNIPYTLTLQLLRLLHFFFFQFFTHIVHTVTIINMHINLTLFYDSKQGYTFLMYTKPVKGSKDWQSLYRSTKLDGFEIGEVAQVLHIANFNRPIPIY